MGSPFRRSGRATLKDWRDERGESSQTERSTEERAERRNTPRLRSILFLKSDPYDQSGHLRVQIVTAKHTWGTWWDRHMTTSSSAESVTCWLLVARVR